MKKNVENKEMQKKAERTVQKYNKGSQRGNKTIKRSRPNNITIMRKNREHQGKKQDKEQ